MKAQRLGTSTGSLINHLMSGSKDSTPIVGTGCSILHWTDRTACTIIEVSENGKTVVVQEDNAVRTDKLGMTDSQSYEYTPNPNGVKHTYTLRRNGKWVAKGESIKGTRLMIGARQHFYDYSF
jgi:hypothetical protein